MKKYILNALLLLSTINSFGQATTKEVYYPHIVLENGTITDLIFDVQKMNLVCNISRNNSTLYINLEDQGTVVEQQISAVENDNIMIDISSLPAGTYNIIIRTEDETFDAGSIEVSTDNN